MKFVDQIIYREKSQKTTEIIRFQSSCKKLLDRRWTIYDLCSAVKYINWSLLSFLTFYSSIISLWWGDGHMRNLYNAVRSLPIFDNDIDILKIVFVEKYLLCHQIFRNIIVISYLRLFFTHIHITHSEWTISFIQ